MKTVRIMLYAILGSLLLSNSSCSRDWCVTGSGNTTTEDRNTRDFDEVRLLCSADVYFKQSDYYSIIVEASDNIIPRVITHVYNGVLEIDLDGCINWGGKVKVTLTAPDLVALENRGSGDVFINRTLDVPSISLSNSGSGNIEVKDINTDYLNALVSGSGNIYVAGNSICPKQTVYISGSGDYDTADLITNDINVTVKGSGDCYTDVTDYLSGLISGSGDIVFYGNPVVSVRITGSGRLVSRN